MKKSIISLSVMLAIPFFANANNFLGNNIDTLKPKEVLNIGISDRELIEALMPLMEYEDGRTREMLQRQNIKPYMMPPRTTDPNGYCTAYVLAACLEYYVNLNSNYKINLSPEYIALMLDKDREDLTKALHFLVTEGTVNAAIIPYDTKKISSAVYGTQKLRIKNYLHIIHENSSKKLKIMDARTALLRGNPVIVEMKIDAAFPTIKDNEYWQPAAFSKTKQTTPLLIVGYDESKKAFEALNVWGREWGTDGYILIKYQDFASHAQNGYVMCPK